VGQKIGCAGAAKPEIVMPGQAHGCPAHFLRYHVYALDSKENGWMKWQSGSVFEVNCA